MSPIHLFYPLYITTPAFGHPLQASLLFLFARHSKNKFFLCPRSFVKSKIEGDFISPPFLLSSFTPFAPFTSFTPFTLMFPFFYIFAPQIQRYEIHGFSNCGIACS